MTMKNDDTYSLPDETCMQMATHIGKQLLPKDSPHVEGAEIVGWTMYSHALGGDFRA